jgi:hypothetical protein
MTKLAKTLAACSAAVLVLGAVAGSASAAPRDDQAPSGGGDRQLQQMVHNDAEPAAAEPRPEHPERFVRIAAFTWSKAVPEIVIQANLTIESALPFALKEIEVACAQFARSGVVIDSRHRTITEVVPAHGRLQVEALDIGPIHPEAGSSGCRIVNVTPA